MRTTLSLSRRQARFVAHRVIPPDGCEANRWYSVCQGRRREDNLPGMVVLDLGTHRVTVPEICVEVREDAPAPALPPPAPDRPARRRWPRVALAVGLPLGLLAVATVRLMVSDPR
jgi:hypothetical protein